MSGHDKTLRAIFSDPVRAGIKWRDIESLLVSFGAEITEGEGSRIRVALHGVKAVFHRPHPTPDTDKGAVRSVRRFLQATGIQP
ncbi:MAG: type II toxin-antitoxin system HicA family toxin [Planctomycetaceae bacterium]|nr:type II toxin-antitoxin system HicA family toxin [Planctomycetaceae bacterium]